MFLFRVSRFCYLAQYISESASYHTGDPSEVIPKENRELLGPGLNQIADEAAQVDLQLTQVAANRLADELDAEVTFQEVNQ